MSASKDIRTTCAYCGVGCGVLATVSPDGISIKGDPDHPSNFGRLCSKGAALGDVLGLEGRLLKPQIYGAEADWDSALDLVARRFSDAISQHGPDSVAFYVSGQLLTEDYYVANKLMKGFIGSANIDTNSRLCMASSVAGHKRAFGEDVVPGTYEDLELADVLILTGSNLAWCHPVLYQRVIAAKSRRPGMKIVVIDPRQTVTVEQADMHLALRPGSDVALFQGLLHWLQTNGFGDAAYVARHVEGMDAALLEAKPWTLAKVAATTGLSRQELGAFYSLFGKAEKTVTVYSQGVNQAADGTDRVGAIINTHLLTSRVGRPGMGPFSVTGQPNAMGGREVGGLANQLACHMDVENPAHRETTQSFWQSPTIAQRPGLKAVDMFDAVHDGRIKAIWIMATNPVDSMPNADKVRAALKACPTVVVSDVTAETDTAQCADILLPAAAWGEKDGTVTNSERRISRQRALKPIPGEARADWDIISDVGRRMGWPEAFPYQSPADVFREYAAMTAFEKDAERALDLSALHDRDYETLDPVIWPISASQTGGRLYGDGRFSTPSRKARAIVPARTVPAQQSASFPYVLNTGRIRDQWHTMTRTGVSPRLSQHMAEPFAEIHPEDALREGISHAGLVTLSSPFGQAVVRALVTPRQRPGSVFVPMHWTEQFAAAARVDALVAPVTDPFSGQPALKGSHVAIAPLKAQWHGFVVARDKPDIKSNYWAMAPCAGGFRIELASHRPLETRFSAWLQSAYPDAERLAYQDASSNQHRTAYFAGDTLIAAGFFGAGGVSVSRQWVAGLVGKEVKKADRVSLLAGRPGADRPDQGALICSCMEVGINTIRAAAQGGHGLEAVCAKTGAGTNCGSCRSEIERILKDAVAQPTPYTEAV
ncbi:MAG: molybdopterin-dependent oxidoreductase [Sphingomonadales bacterium]